MNRILILHAFAKAEQEIKKTGVLQPSLTQKATHISDFIEENEGFTIGERSLRVYRGEAIKLDGENDDIRIKQLHVISGLCKYMGYDNYQEYVSNEVFNDTVKSGKLEGKKINPVRLVKILITILALGIIAILIYSYSNRQRWMVWQEDHYEEVDFDAGTYGLKRLKLLNEDKLTAFRKVEVTCDTIFFNDDNSVRYWYGKNRKRELEFFTDVGLHPETGKTLKSITPYMIKKWICID